MQRWPERIVAVRLQVDLDDLTGLALAHDFGIRRSDVPAHADIITDLDDSGAHKHKDSHDSFGDTDSDYGMSDYFCARPAGTSLLERMGLEPSEGALVRPVSQARPAAYPPEYQVRNSFVNRQSEFRLTNSSAFSNIKTQERGEPPQQDGIDPVAHQCHDGTGESRWPGMRVPIEPAEETPGEKQACCQCPRCDIWSRADRCPQCGAHKGSLAAVPAKTEADSQQERLA